MVNVVHKECGIILIIKRVVVSLASQIVVAIAIKLRSKIHNKHLHVCTSIILFATVFLLMQCNFLVLTMVQVCMHDSEWICN